MHRILQALIGLILLSGLRSADAAPTTPDRPNIVVIVADDLGWNDVGFHGSPIKTPQLDGLAAKGVQLDQYYVAPVCSPTRTALMSGRYWSRFGVTTPTNDQCMPFGTTTLASALKQVGYQTALSGKWHLGSLLTQGPNEFGFDRSYGSMAGGCGPFNHRYKEGAFTQNWHRDRAYVEETGHVTDLIAAEAVAVIGQKRQPGTPLFMYVPFTAPHLPIKEPEEWMNFNPQIADPAFRLYAACVSHLDAGVGRIVAAIEKGGEADNTVLIFFSDNGGSTDVENNDTKYPADDYANVRLPASNQPLHGKKGQVYEGGIRVPAVVYWPARLKASVVHAPLHVVDWMPTLTKLAGFSAAEDLKWDGQDAWPTIAGTKPAASRDLYWLGVNERSAAVRSGDWKLVVDRPAPKKENADAKKPKPDAQKPKSNTKKPRAGNAPADKAELYNLASDPNEQHNLVGDEPDRVATLRRLMDQLSQRDHDSVVDRKGKPSAGD